MASVAINNGKKALLINDMDSVTLKVMLMDPAYTPDVDNDDYVSDISASRATGTTDITLSNVTFTVDDTSNVVKIDFDNFVTGSVTTDTNAYMVYISTGVDSTSANLFYIELTDGITTPKTFSTVTGAITVTIPTGGAISI